MSLLSQAKKLPQSPGVYLFVNNKGKVLYVGKATSLRRRVLSYFKNTLEPRLTEMINLASQIKYYKTANVLEAIILEANLIKKYWPKYNIRERDNRSFVFIVIPKTDYPKPLVMRGKELTNFLGISNNNLNDLKKFLKQQNSRKQKFYIFGPYQSLDLVYKFLRIIRKIFPYSTCVPFSGRPCFDYQIGLCPGLCVGAISKQDYQKNIRNLVLFLSGQKKKLMKILSQENPEEVKALGQIQDAALITRDIFEENKGQVNFSYLLRIEGYDISHLSGQEPYGSMVVFKNGEACPQDYRLFKIKQAPKSDDLRALAEVITRRFHHPEWQFPNLILIDGGKPQVDFITKTLQQLKINIPVVGLSKYANDKLVFGSHTSRSFKELIYSFKSVLLKVREGAHRFAIKSSRKKRRLQNYYSE